MQRSSSAIGEQKGRWEGKDGINEMVKWMELWEVWREGEGDAKSKKFAHLQGWDGRKREGAVAETFEQNVRQSGLVQTKF